MRATEFLTCCRDLSMQIVMWQISKKCHIPKYLLVVWESQQVLSSVLKGGIKETKQNSVNPVSTLSDCAPSENNSTRLNFHYQKTVLQTTVPFIAELIIA